MIVVYSPDYHIDIGAHVFPTRKYHLLHDRIRASAADAVVFEPAPAAWDDLALVHTADYLDKILTGRFTIGELAQLEIPWAPEVVDGFRLMTGGTLDAARHAIRSDGDRIAFHIGGGFHHAFADHGEGFCLFNDVALAVRVMARDAGVERAAIIDLDVHHGNGTAAIFGGDANVFTFSMHQQFNYPSIKPPGTLDVGLPNGAADEHYLEELQPALAAVMAHAPQMAYYLAGADPFHDDQLGGLALTKSGLRARDRLVFDTCRGANVPVVVVLAGGYARHVEDTVDIHFATFEEARRTAGRPPGTSH